MPTREAQHVPEERLINVAIGAGLHRRVKAAAAIRGLTLQEFVQRSLEASVPTHLGMSQQNGKTRTNVPVDPAA